MELELENFELLVRVEIILSRIWVVDIPSNPQIFFKKTF